MLCTAAAYLHATTATHTHTYTHLSSSSTHCTFTYKIANFCKNKIETCVSFMEDANFSTILSRLFWNKSKLNVSIRHSLFEYWKGLYYWLMLLYRFSDNIVAMTKYEKDNLIKKFRIHENKNKINI